MESVCELVDGNRCDCLFRTRERFFANDIFRMHDVVVSLNSSITWSVDKASLGMGIKRKDLLPELLAQVQKPLSSFLGFKCLLFRIKTWIYTSSLLCH